MNLSWGSDSKDGCARPLAGRDRAVGHPPEVPATPPGATLHARLAEELAPMVEVWERLLVLHLPDRSGRCRTCTEGGTGLPGTPWPCSLHGLAELAQRRHDRAQGV